MSTEQTNNKNEPEDILDLSTPEDDNLEYEPFSEEIDPTTPDAEQTSEPSPETLSEDQVQIKILQEQLDKTKDQMIRALAEAENARKRAQKDREDASKFAVSSFARDLVNVADNLRRALDATPEEPDDATKGLIGGIEATERELLKSFEKNGIKKTVPIDQPFDPNFHEVMFEAPIPEKANGTIIQVMEPGYTLNGRILRPARVGVAKNADNVAPEAQSEPGQNINTEA